MHNHYKVKPLHIMLPKTSAFVNIYDRQTKCMYFLNENDDLLENLIVFGINSALI